MQRKLLISSPASRGWPHEYSLSIIATQSAILTRPLLSMVKGWWGRHREEAVLKLTHKHFLVAISSTTSAYELWQPLRIQHSWQEKSVELSCLGIVSSEISVVAVSLSVSDTQLKYGLNNVTVVSNIEPSSVQSNPSAGPSDENFWLRSP